MLNVIINGTRYAEVKQPAPLHTDEWDALVAAERPLYYRNPGANGYTDVMINDGDIVLNTVWDHCEMNLDGDGSLDGLSEAVKNARIANRVARVFLLMAFGPEALIV